MLRIQRTRHLRYPADKSCRTARWKPIIWKSATEEELMVVHEYTIEDMQAHFLDHREFSRKIADLRQDLKQ